MIGVIRERMPTGGSGGSQAAEDFNSDVYIPLSTSVARFGEIIYRPHVRLVHAASRSSSAR